MEASERKAVLDQLEQLDAERGTRLVLKVGRTTGPLEPEPDPRDYDSDVDYRSALIVRAAKAGKAATEQLANRLRTRALAVTEGHLTHTLVIEGPIAELARAMSEPEVEYAIPDLTLNGLDGSPEESEGSD